MKFLDLTKVYIRSGSGGGGAVSFRRENSSNMAVPMEATAAMADRFGRGGRGIEHPDRFSLSTTLFRG